MIKTRVFTEEIIWEASKMILQPVEVDKQNPDFPSLVSWSSLIQCMVQNP